MGSFLKDAKGFFELDMIKNKRISFFVIIFLLFFVFVDTSLYGFFFLLNKKRNLFYDRTDVSVKRIDYWLSNSFDAELGWNLPKNEQNNLGARRIQDYPLKDKYKIKIFGDSFVYGSEVKIEDTFAAQVESMTGWDCLNYGVGSYGTDQALLKYKNSSVPTDYVILEILSENIGRVVSYYQAFYMREWSPPKPRFVKQGDHMVLLPSPVINREDAYKLLDKNFVNQLKADDYWSQYYEKILQAPARLKWPASIMIIKHWPFFYERIALELKRMISPSFSVEAGKYKYSHLYQSQTEALEIMKYIVDEFVRLARERGERPVIVMFPDQFSMDLVTKYNQLIYSPLQEYIDSQGYNYIDFSVSFRNQDYSEFYNYYNGHYSSRGNHFVARELVNFIQKLDRDKDKI